MAREGLEVADVFRHFGPVFRDQHGASLSPSLSLCSRPGHKRMIALARKQDFARYLRDARIKRHMSVAEVAEQVGVSTASIYFWENDRVRPREGNLSALCKVLKLPIRATREMATG